MPEIQHVALVREPGAALNRCELTHLARVPIDVARARTQHANYVAALAALGAAIEWLPPLDHQPDAVFVEDTAVIFPEVAVLTWPGVSSRQTEVASVAPALAGYRIVRQVRPPAFLDGGDVLRLGHRVLVGLSSRTNAAGAAALRDAIAEFGYDVSAVHVRGALHLKSACTAIADDRVVANLAAIDATLLAGLAIIEVDERESRAANTLTLGGVTLVSAAFPRTEERLRGAGVSTRAVDVSELEKAESGLTCMSLIFSVGAHDEALGATGP
ncbi:MAG TPA: N(G),N(G)-dimethylarginine dimethylaminohydrolase [Steroidobacteraceae bacterium]|nr:N(G),N(G)-dimethylarginine dimethylaminohydrolase [Steroidobacteraceae bacterium]